MLGMHEMPVVLHNASMPCPITGVSPMLNVIIKMHFTEGITAGFWMCKV